MYLGGLGNMLPDKVYSAIPGNLVAKGAKKRIVLIADCFKDKGISPHIGNFIGINRGTGRVFLLRCKSRQ